MSGELDLAAGVGPLAHRGLPELLLERVGPELGVAIGTMMVQPAVLDACAFVSDVRRRVLSGYPTKLHGAANMGFMRLYCTRQVWAEVPRVLEDDADQLGIDAEEALSVWFGEYHPLVKVVDTTTLQGLASLPGLSERDASDLPTADLIGLLAPVLAFSTDKDLAGVTVSRWVASSQATAVAGLIDSATFGAVTGTAWVISNREQIITPVRKVAASPQLPRVLLGLGRVGPCRVYLRPRGHHLVAQEVTTRRGPTCGWHWALPRHRRCHPGAGTKHHFRSQLLSPERRPATPRVR
jgi:hypothetical protein